MDAWRMYLWVAFGGGLGSVARVATGAWLARIGATPHGATLAVNVTGSLLIGVLAALTLPGGRWSVGPAGQPFLMAGFCGGFTTFSAFSLQTIELLRGRATGMALLNVAVSVALCLVAAWAGLLLGQALAGRR
ncbi:MAG: fluoride efflux transporter FluC [Limisphaerales bacterium]